MYVIIISRFYFLTPPPEVWRGETKRGKFKSNNLLYKMPYWI